MTLKNEVKKILKRLAVIENAIKGGANEWYNRCYKKELISAKGAIHKPNEYIGCRVTTICGNQPDIHDISIEIIKREKINRDHAHVNLNLEEAKKVHWILAKKIIELETKTK